MFTLLFGQQTTIKEWGRVREEGGEALQVSSEAILEALTR